MKDEAKIFITTGGGVGDLIMFTPALRRIKELYPNCQLTVLTKQQTVEVINRIPWIDRVVGVKRGTFMSRFRALEDIYGQDYLITTDWQPHLLPFAAAFGIPHRIGKPRAHKAISKLLTAHLPYDVLREEEYAAITNGKNFSAALGITLDGDLTVPSVSMPTETESRTVHARLERMGVSPHTPFILLTPYSSRYERDWPVDYIYEFCRTAEERFHMPVVVAGMTKEHNDPLPQAPYNFINQTTFAELVALVDMATYHVAVDSGPMHVAAAVGTTVISLFNKDLPIRWAPRHHSYPIYLGDDSLQRDYGIEPTFINADDVTDMCNITPSLVCQILTTIMNK